MSKCTFCSAKNKNNDWKTTDDNHDMIICDDCISNIREGWSNLVGKKCKINIYSAGAGLNIGDIGTIVRIPTTENNYYATTADELSLEVQFDSGYITVFNQGGVTIEE